MLAIGIPWEIHAENATVTFGSNYYTATDNETFPIGVYLNGDSRIGTYEVKISYDSRRLEYTGGGDSEENGVITLSGTGVNAQVKYMLKFQTRSGGTADIKIESAVIHTAGENAEEFDVTTLASTYVTISGEDTVGDTPPEESQETGNRRRESGFGYSDCDGSAGGGADLLSGGSLPVHAGEHRFPV